MYLFARIILDDAHLTEAQLAVRVCFVCPLGGVPRVLEAFRRPISVTLRTRLRGEVYSRKGQLERVFYSLNEFIVNRGISGVLSTLEVGWR